MDKRNRPVALRRFVVRNFATATLLGACLSACHASAQTTTQAEWLPLCGKCIKPTVFSKSGIGTARAVAEAKVTFQDAKDHCEAWSMSEHPDCDNDAKAALKAENAKIYKATADCVHGKLTTATGDTVTYAGLWSSGYLKGKTRWRWVSGYDKGKIVSPDGPVNAPMISATSDILCPGGVGAARN
jgi:hypothetical protein